MQVRASETSARRNKPRPEVDFGPPNLGDKSHKSCGRGYQRYFGLSKNTLDLNRILFTRWKRVFTVIGGCSSRLIGASSPRVQTVDQTQLSLFPNHTSNLSSDYGCAIPALVILPAAVDFAFAL